MGARASHRGKKSSPRFRETSHCARKSRISSYRACRPDRTRCRRQLCHPRLQDRTAADRAASPHRIGAATHFGSGNPAQRRLLWYCPGSVSEIGYVRLKGGDPPGEPRSVKITQGTPDTYADIALRKLTDIAKKFIVDGEPYRSLVHPMWKNITESTITLRGSRSGRPPVAKVSSTRDPLARFRTLPGPARPRPPIPNDRCSSPPMPVPGRRMCWSNGLSPAAAR